MRHPGKEKTNKKRSNNVYTKRAEWKDTIDFPVYGNNRDVTGYATDESPGANE
jgi:hypothetical protein